MARLADAAFDFRVLLDGLILQSLNLLAELGRGPVDLFLRKGPHQELTFEGGGDSRNHIERWTERGARIALQLSLRTSRLGTAHPSHPRHCGHSHLRESGSLAQYQQCDNGQGPQSQFVHVRSLPPQANPSFVKPALQIVPLPASDLQCLSCLVQFTLEDSGPGIAARAALQGPYRPIAQQRDTEQ